ncbi:hypothetical protein KZZ07_16300 [Mameliella sp. CS4]|uniref:hypothetical protein n=1 Tax=Mameliella sp. CS4 TaxID=2862329 RepID=UPI001C5F4D13|nr:hypothetical protein [Mameliella sp. CS4]MBW4984105.1 hypothetical protein [Mameliella sp. CS4]
MRFLSGLISLALLASPLQAATLETDISPKMAEMGCTARLSGPIEAGDLERISPFLESSLTGGFDDPDFRPDVIFRQFSPALDYAPDAIFTHRLCLNSAGGSLVEALRIVAYIQDQSSDRGGGPAGIQTAIARDDRCTGACALVFLAGRFVRFSGNPAYEGRSNFILHPKGRLNLHAPAIDLTEDSYTTEVARRIWDVGMQSNARIAAMIARGGIFMSDGLFAEMLAHPVNDPLLLDTVEQAVRWGVDVEPNVLNHGRYPFTQEQFFDAICRNSRGHAPSHVDLRPGSGGMKLTRDGEVMRSTGAYVDARSGRPYECEIDAGQWEEFQTWLHPDAFGGVQMPRLRFSCYNARVRLVSQVECYDCDLAIELGCMGVLPPDLPIVDIYMDPPLP